MKSVKRILKCGSPQFVPAVLLGLFITVAGTAVPAQAAQLITTCGTVISSPGNYVLASNLTCTGDGIDISSSNVSVSLAGYTINGPCASNGSGSGGGATVLTAPSGCSAVGINIQVTNGGRVDHIAVQGPGQIGHFFNGIAISGADYSQVALVTVSQNLANGIWASNTTFLTVGSNVAGGNLNGILVDSSSNSSVSYNNSFGNSGAGILVTGGANSGNNTLSNNNSSGNGGSGIEIAATGSRVYSNTTQVNAADGILLDASGSANQVFNNPSSVGNGIWDMVDTSTACGTDFWGSNTFFTSNQTCIN